ncbi:MULTISPECIES: WYL domain-containing protein [Actinomycetes]|uniref:WYL domain-containing protein n=1 Tax=Actinomycetes TaxID=1760 RepID=UPI0001B55B81|nr:MULTISPECIES: WYL domain-containing protein [Actinomycetes]
MNPQVGDRDPLQFDKASREARTGEDRTYPPSRVLAAEELDQPDRVDPGRARQERSTRFRTGGGDQIVALVRIRPEQREELARTALAIRGEEINTNGWLRLEAAFPDSRYAEWALWQLAENAEVLAPQAMRAARHERAAAIAAACAEPA